MWSSVKPRGPNEMYPISARRNEGAAPFSASGKLKQVSPQGEVQVVGHSPLAKLAFLRQFDSLSWAPQVFFFATAWPDAKAQRWEFAIELLEMMSRSPWEFRGEG